jgi:antitoxin ParD1/3/4
MRYRVFTPTRNISLTPEQDAFVDEVVEAGEYQNASEAVRDALRALQQRRQLDALKLEALRTALRQGVAALERGDFTDVQEGELDRFLSALSPRRPRPRRNARKRAR